MRIVRNIETLKIHPPILLVNKDLKVFRAVRESNIMGASQFYESTTREISLLS